MENNNKTITAVEWLVTQLEGEESLVARIVGLKEYNQIVKQAKQMENEQRFDNKATRFEVIDHTDKKRGRIVVEYGVDVEISIQDDGQTMKVFLTNNK
jgi:hypothetical protein